MELKYRFTEKQIFASRLLGDASKVFYLFYGGSRSGKTYLSCVFIIVRALYFPGSRHLVARYSFANARTTIWLQTLYPMLRIFEKSGQCKISKTECVCTFKNGSVIILDGLEESRKESVLAAEYGTIFITEANENKYEIVEMLMSRLNDTSIDQYGNRIHLKFICDLNPTVKTHWTYQLFIAGLEPVTGQPKTNYHEYVAIQFRPEDNQENLSDGYISHLQSLSPAMRRRFYEGEFGSYQGLVFQLEESKHIVDDFKIPSEWKRFRSIDFGYTHNFVCLWGAYDHNSELLYLYREYSSSRITVRQHAEVIQELTGKEQVACTVADHDAEDRATMNENGIKTIKADKRVLVGIDRMVDLLLSNEGKKTSIKIFRSCAGLITEFYSYRWRDPATRLPRDREVVKENDDHIDALRYMVMEVFKPEICPGIALRPEDRAHLNLTRKAESLENDSFAVPLSALRSGMQKKTLEEIAKEMIRKNAFPR